MPSHPKPDHFAKPDNILKVSKRANVRRKPTDFKKVFGHYIYNTHYVLYVMELYNGKTVAGTEEEFKDQKIMIHNYKVKLTCQNAPMDDAIVESILTHRMVDGRPMYLVQWDGFPSPVWYTEVAEEKLQNWKHLLDEYNDMINSTEDKINNI